MKKLIGLIFIVVFANSPIFSQVIKLENGVAISSLNSTKFDFLNKHITTYSLLVGMDYWENKIFYLSSEAGYLQKGGKEENEFLPENGANINESWNYIHLNTTIRFPFQLENNAHFFIGAGPKLDFLIGSDKFENPIYAGYNMNSISFGVKGELGFVKDFDRIRTGINFSYLYDLNKAGGTKVLDFKNNTYEIMLSLGYRLW